MMDVSSAPTLMSKPLLLRSGETYLVDPRMNGNEPSHIVVSIKHLKHTPRKHTGRKVAESAAKTLKRVTLELGGNDGCIVCPDIDVKAVAAKVAAGVLIHF
jgi:hypothetical protein